MLGDATGAFRHVPIHAQHVHVFGFLIDVLLVLDLSCGFGWCGSPTLYSLAGAHINSQYEFGHGLSNNLVGNVWCVDHINVEADINTRCFDVNLALRIALATVLGPSAINELKFTKCATTGKALGLLWETDRECVSIPSDKIEKALHRVQSALHAKKATKTTLMQVLGSLRHVSCCFRPASSFFQRLQTTVNSFPRLGNHRLDGSAIDDLKWFSTVLRNAGRFNSIPIATFADLAEPSIHVYMDVSNEGLCVLKPQLRRYIRQNFSSDKVSNLSINIRELRSVVLAALIWGPVWASSPKDGPTHIRFHIDNTAAVAWVDNQYSSHPQAQLYNLLLSLAEFQHNMVCTATHITGKMNTMADAGSRVWSHTHPLLTAWTNLSASWQQGPLQPPFNNLSDAWEQCCADVP